jgi:hypothetical protein
VFSTFLSHQKKLQLLPSKMGVIKAKGDEKSITIQNFNFGDKYIKCISKGIDRIYYKQYNFR